MVNVVQGQNKKNERKGEKNSILGSLGTDKGLVQLSTL